MQIQILIGNTQKDNVKLNSHESKGKEPESTTPIAHTRAGNEAPEVSAPVPLPSHTQAWATCALEPEH